VDEVEGLLKAAQAGDPAAQERLYRLLYDDLARIARSRLRGAHVTLADTGYLVHEGWLRLHRQQGLSLDTRGAFLAYSARVMQSVLVDAARRRQAERRGGDADRITLDTALGERLAEPDESHPLLDVHEAIEALARLDPALADLVRLRFFAGLGEAELAATLGLSERMVRRRWQKARAFLIVNLQDIAADQRAKG
jgi:RNA polymerase sigma factor (TIGR02999 family)